MCYENIFEIFSCKKDFKKQKFVLLDVYRYGGDVLIYGEC